MFKIIILLLGLLLIGLAACSVYKQKGVVKTDAEIWVSYSRGACFGKCPVYEFIIFENGEAEYVGEENVERLGTYTSSLDSAQIATLKSAFENSGFPSLEDEYLSNISDLPVISIEYKMKTCDFHKRNAPKPLWELVRQMEECINQLQWTKG